MKGFEYYVKRIEDEMIAALLEKVGGDEGYTQNVIVYRGELDSDELKKESKQALTRIVSKLPMFLITYADGEDEIDPQYPWIAGEPRTIKQYCTFSVICCAGDARGERAGQSAKTAGVGVYRMIQDAQEALMGRKFIVVENDMKIPLNLSPLGPSQPPNPEYVVRMDELTVYAVHFDTFFKYQSTDWQGVTTEVETMTFDLDPLNPESAATGEKPGVNVQ